MRPRHRGAGRAAAAAAAAGGCRRRPPAPRRRLDSGDTAWMLTSIALVLMMTIPGLALFYGGMVRKKNVLATLMQSFAITCLVTVLWTIISYSLAFTGPAPAPYIGAVALYAARLGPVRSTDTASSWHRLDQRPRQDHPRIGLYVFQMTFAIITPALICGSFADRMKFSRDDVVHGRCGRILVYCPDRPLGLGPERLPRHRWACSDYAGGTVVHINAGVAGLVTALVLGKRNGYRTEPMPPHNLILP